MMTTLKPSVMAACGEGEGVSLTLVFSFCGV